MIGAPLVLLCDDDPSVLEKVGAMIEAHGYRVNRASSGQQAMSMAAAEAPAIIVLDLLMPRMDGWETAAALRRQVGTEEVPVVIFSILGQSEAEPVAAIVVAWLQKPVPDQVLIEALERALGSGPIG